MTELSAKVRFGSVFGCKPVLAMLHLKGESAQCRLRRAHREIDIFEDTGVDGVVVENYFGTPDDVESVLDYLSTQRPQLVYGVNVLDDDARGFELARRYGAAFIQLDSVAGHLAPDDDSRFSEWLTEQRGQTSALVLGGVRFKYQPILSGNTLEADLGLAVDRCDAVVVTGAGTGMETDLNKIAQFREILGDSFPLIAGAGVTARNGEAQLSAADGAIVGSYLKDTFTDEGEISADHVEMLMVEVRRARRAVAANTPIGG